MDKFFLEFLDSSYKLFLDMAPYLILGMGVTGLLSIVLKRSLVMKYVGGNSWGAVFRASLFGVPLPLCSCGVLPTASYLRDNGASKPAVQSFLISTPQTGFDSIIATYGMMGPVLAIYRALAAFLLGVIGGFFSKILSGPEQTPETAASHELPRLSLGASIKKGLNYGFIEFIDDIAVQFLVGLALAGVMSAAIPDDFFAGTALSGGITGMLVMAAAGIPLYMCSTSSIPIAVALMAKGVTPGAAFVLLAAGPATNAATIAVLGKKLGRKHTLIYLSVLVFGSIAFGLLLDYLIRVFSLEQGIWGRETAAAAELLPQWVTVTSAVLLILLIVYSFMKRLRGKKPCDDAQCRASDNQPA